MDVQDLAGDLAVFGEAAAVAITKAEVYVLGAEQIIASHTGMAFTANVCSIV